MWTISTAAHFFYNCKYAHCWNVTKAFLSKTFQQQNLELEVSIGFICFNVPRLEVLQNSCKAFSRTTTSGQ